MKELPIRISREAIIDGHLEFYDDDRRKLQKEGKIITVDDILDLVNAFKEIKKSGML
jgi:hypothetical protein